MKKTDPIEILEAMNLKNAGRFLRAKDHDRIEALPTPLPEFNSYVSGIGGLPIGQLTEIAGGEFSGKTTFLLNVIAHAQQSEKVAVYFDTEQNFDPQWAEKIGIDLSSLVIVHPSSGDVGFEQICSLVGNVDLIIIDSLSALTPEVHLDKEYGKNKKLGAHAALVAEYVNRLIAGSKKHAQPALRDSGTCLVASNQVREKPNVMYGSPLDVTGGRAWKHHVRLRLWFSNLGVDQKTKDRRGVPTRQKIRIKAKYSQIGVPLRETEFWLPYDTGRIEQISNITLLDVARDRGIVSVGPTGWISWNQEFFNSRNVKTPEKIRGLRKFEQFLEDNPTIKSLIEEETNGD